ncbi:Gfo/Idh/MocA family protein [Methylocapsa sp. S129]|uniref:Gfo/Idh/MocA family protein n=1 Tax=Methylocapsa sp. S129 TaxID=1641869 RepID=UPI00131A8436|nr:Gfo/Idh/MocA family oxidoreductase [Methylocapsa sp. S129]
MKSYSIGVIGIGKITQDQHLPVIAKDPRFRLAGLVSQRGLQQPDVPTFRTPAELYAALPDLDAVAICTPPSVRHAIAREALDAGKHVLLEKPPAPTMAEMNDLTSYAAARGKVIFATWHSQYNAAVDEAKKRLAGKKIRSLHIEWKEDVRRWHPGQEWIWDAGNFGVFDPGINALSIFTKIMPAPAFVKSADLVYPANRDTPIAASLVLTSLACENAASRLTAEFDWRQEGDQSWNINVATGDGVALRLTHGGSKLLVDGALTVEAPMAEYEGIYRHFAELLDAGRGAMDAAPFQLVADAFLVGRRTTTEAFVW